MKVTLEELKEIKNETETAFLRLARQKGYMTITKRQNRVEYYHVKFPKDPKPDYLRMNIPKERERAVRLAQKSYLKKVLAVEKQWVKWMENCKATKPRVLVSEVYDELAKERKMLVTPVVETDEVCANKWEAAEYRRLEYDEEGVNRLETDRGDLVRSKSEVIWANKLLRAGLPYRYEPEIRLRGYRKVYPDFVVFDARERCEVVIEHLGMVDDAVYLAKNAEKMMLYQNSGFVLGVNLFVTMESRAQPLKPEVIDGIIGRIRGEKNGVVEV